MTYPTWCIFGTVMFYFGSAFLCFICLFFNDFDTESEFVRAFYFRKDTYDSSKIGIGKFLYYLLMNIIGTLYVTIVSLKNERQSPLHDQHKSTASFKLTVFLVTPILFFLSMNINLKSSLDYSNECQAENLQMKYDKVSELTSSLEMMFSLVSIESAERCPYGAIDVFLWNWGVWTTAYFLGL
jgi:hypothetical protein